jgi:hypothetical protein
MSETQSTQDGDEKCTQHFSLKFRGKKQLGYLRIGGRIILKHIL